MPIDDRTEIARRMEAIGLSTGNLEQGHPDLPRDPWQPRWRIDAKWIEFECGCRAERCQKLNGPRKSDPIIFEGMAQQAVYDFVCQRHLPGMNVYVRFGQFADFAQWHKARRATLMGKVRP